VKLLEPIGGRLQKVGEWLAGYRVTEPGTSRGDWSRPVHSSKLDLPNAKRLQIVGVSREMERNDAIMQRFLDLLELYGVGPSGLTLRAATQDGDWNLAADEIWRTWSRYPDLTSRQSFGQLQRMIIRAVAVDGEIFAILTRSRNGRPRIQLIETHRVKNPTNVVKMPERLDDGIELDEYGRPVAYWVQQEDLRNGMGIGEFRRFDADDVVHFYDPSRTSQRRGLPLFYAVLNDLIDLQELQGLEMKAAKDNARVSRVKTRTPDAPGDGIGASLRRPDTATTNADKEVDVEQAIGGEQFNLRPGEDLKVLQSSRPSVAVQQFWDYVAARVAAGGGLPIELILMRSLQGTMARGAFEMANTFFRSWSHALAEPLGLIREYVLQTEMDRGFLADGPNGWREFRFTPPRSIMVDVGRASAALISEWRAGFTTLEDVCGQAGKDWREVLAQRAREIAAARQIAAEAGISAAELLQITPLTSPAPAAT
jgi:lambda family phage portal protein